MLNVVNHSARADASRSPIFGSKFSVRACLAVWTLLVIAPGASADSLEGYKSAGDVGERPDGYVGIVVANPSAELRAFVDDINARRRAKYADLAAKNGTDVESVAALAGKKLIERSNAGDVVMDGAGNWRKRR